MFFRQAVARVGKRLQISAPLRSRTSDIIKNRGHFEISLQHGFGDQKWWRHQSEAFQWIFLCGQAIILGMNTMPSMADDGSVKKSSVSETSVADVTSLRKVEDGSVISNEHTVKWRVFTDNGRDYFMQGKLEQSEKFFLSAVQEAREGFGETDPHVASACNNLAELYRVQKAFDKAEPLYMKAIHILEDHFGKDDIRVGAAFHNLGQFFLVQKELERAQHCYEHALKIKRRVLGEMNSDYADTMYHLGTVFYLQEKEKESQDLISHSIQILEESGQGESIICIKRLQYLAQIYTKFGRLSEAELIQRKTLHKLELSKGWKSLGTVIAGEQLALTIQASGNLSEAEELLERCLDSRKRLLPSEHIQNAANMLYLARVKILISEKLMKSNKSQALDKLDSAKNLLKASIRIARLVFLRFVEQKHISEFARKDGHSGLLILLQSLNTFGSLELTKLQIHDSKGIVPSEAEPLFLQFMSTFKEFAINKPFFDSPEVKAEYLACLRCLYSLINERNADEKGRLEEIEAEITNFEESIKEAADYNKK